jgi:hypothetical protein
MQLLILHSDTTGMLTDNPSLEFIGWGVIGDEVIM